MTKPRKQIRMMVTISAPHWMNDQQARKTVREALNDHPYGYEVSQEEPVNFNQVNDYIRARKIEPA